MEAADVSPHARDPLIGLLVEVTHYRTPVNHFNGGVLGEQLPPGLRNRRFNHIFTGIGLIPSKEK